MKNLTEPTIGMVVLNYNDYQTTLNFLNEIKKNRLINLMVIVDNQSTDDSFKILKKEETEKIKVVSTDSNKGYASGNNFGIKILNNSICPDYVIIANPDVSFDDIYIKEMLECFKVHSDTVAVAGKMQSSANINTPKVAWKLPNYFDLILSNFLILRRFIGDKTLYKESYLNSDRFVRVDVIPGSLLFVKNESFFKLGYFDEDTFLYEEENILSHKIKNNKQSVYLATRVCYAHNHAVSINKSIPNVGKRLDIDFRSRKIYASKYLKIGEIEKAIFNFTYYVGKFNYINCLKIAKIKR